MADEQFERPGAAHHPSPHDWPYHVPTPEEPTRATNPDDAPDPDPQPRNTRPKRFLTLTAVISGVLAGALLGASGTAWVLRDQPEPEAIPITLDTFPRELLGAQRNDVALREAAYGPTVERLDAEFSQQLTNHRFSYGGDGAAFGYGRLLELTVVNGILSPALPRDQATNRDGRVTQTRRMISLQTDTVSCTFEPLPVLDPKTGIEQPGDFTSDGRTECVLVERQRNLSLRISQPRPARGWDALETSDSFKAELERLHATLAD